MIRSLKRLGLAFVAVLAMGAMVASAAQAMPSYTASSYPATATGSNVAGSETCTTPGGFPQCDSHFEGTLATASSTLTVMPVYNNCVAFGFLGASVDMMGCDYLFHTGSPRGGGVYDHKVDIVCPSGNSIRITSGTCEVDIPTQTGLSNVKTTNLANGQITVQQEISNITMNVTKDGFGCAYAGTGHFTGSYHGDVLFSRAGGGSISVSGS